MSKEEDHDILIRIDENLQFLVMAFDKHQQDDNQRFEKMDKRIQVMERAFYSVGGVIVFLEIFLRFV